MVFIPAGLCGEPFAASFSGTNHQAYHHGAGAWLVRPYNPHPPTQPTPFLDPQWLWGVFTVPLLPLAATPLPNIPIYYAVYRFYSNYAALHGCGGLKSLLDCHEAYELGRLQQQLKSYKDYAFPPKSWPAVLRQGGRQYRGSLAELRARLKRAKATWGEEVGGDDVRPAWVASKELEALVEPFARWV